MEELNRRKCFSPQEKEYIYVRKEKINVGDVITYIETNCVQGYIRNNIHRISSVVLVVDPDAPYGEKIITSEGLSILQV